MEFKSFSDREIKDCLLMKKEKFGPGIYEKYIDEAKSRNIDLSFMNAMTGELVEKEKNLRFIHFGYAFAFINIFVGFYLGLFIMLSKKKEGNNSISRFNDKEKISGIIIMIISGIIPFVKFVADFLGAMIKDLIH